jgi:hypothetical protein
MNCFQAQILKSFNPKLSIEINQYSEDDAFTYSTVGDFDIIPSQTIYTAFTAKELKCKLGEVIFNRCNNFDGEYYFYKPLSFALIKRGMCSNPIGLEGYIASKPSTSTNLVTTTITRKSDGNVTTINYDSNSINYKWSSFYVGGSTYIHLAHTSIDTFAIPELQYYIVDPDDPPRNLLPIGGFLPSWNLNPNEGGPPYITGFYGGSYNPYPHPYFRSMNIGTCDLGGHSPIEVASRNRNSSYWFYLNLGGWVELNVYDGETKSNGEGMTVTVKLF